MTTSTATDPPPYATLDARITRALLALRQARSVASQSPNRETLELQKRAEEELDALLDYRSALRRRASDARP